jgi:alkanesulfonate monooxygenase SsuD/methylene tetrahydromethanopterin reductase-like flavin-dependent oxidoreductase (luciferase family)
LYAPVQQPHPPIWIGGDGPKRTLPLVARYADAWHTWPAENYAAVLWSMSSSG